jgi:4a-hydroxytetrahydrobiopterin dehydratase
MRLAKLNRPAITQGLQTLDNWALDADSASISKTWTFNSFRTAMTFFAEVGEIAERDQHHPEFLSVYTRMQIRLTTHDADGLTHKDFELAAEIDRLVRRDFINLLKSQ